MNQELVAAFFEEQPQPAFWMRPLLDSEGSIIDFEYAYCNREFYAYTGLPKETVLGKSVSDSPLITSEDLRKQFFQQLLHVYQAGTPMQDRFHNLHLNRYYSYTRSKVSDGVLTVLQDRTEEITIIQQLEEQTALTQSLLRQSANGITVSEVIRNDAGKVVDGKTILANDAAEQYMMIPKEDYLAKTIAQIDPGIMKSELYTMSMKTLETGEPFHTQYYFEPSAKWIALSVSKMDDNRLINIFTDITETKMIELERKLAAERLKAVFNASQSGMFIFAPVYNTEAEIIDFRFVITNPTFAAYVGQTPQALEHELGSTWFPGYLVNGVFDMYKSTYLTGETARKEIHYNVDGHDLYLDLLSTKVGDEVLITFNDYTAVKSSQVQLETLVQELKRSNSYLEEFAHAASHDLKEPIRKIQTFSGILQNSLMERLTPDELRLFERMSAASVRMKQLVNDLLDYSYVSTSAPLQMEPVDLNERVKLVLVDLEIQVEESGAIINIEPLPTVTGFKRQLQQLFQNLLSNALKYRQAGSPPEITIRSSIVTGKEVTDSLPEAAGGQTFHCIEVRDNGIGFEQQYADKIFNMFQRLHGKQEYAGTGVGLSIARKVVENHNGAIWAQSSPGEGSSFFILLPIQQL
ncbi:MAG TPA: ATP-binding protein [Flavisolibacter sp.]